MNSAPNTRPRHALRWVLGVGLVFLVVSAMALQAARRRTDERWERVMAHWEQATRLSNLYKPGHYGPPPTNPPPGMGPPAPSRREPIRYLMDIGTERTGGNIFWEWRRCQWGEQFNELVLRQERNLFGSRIEARFSRGLPLLADHLREVLAAVDIELVVEP